MPFIRILCDNIWRHESRNRTNIRMNVLVDRATKRGDKTLYDLVDGEPVLLCALLMRFRILLRKVCGPFCHRPGLSRSSKHDDLRRGRRRLNRVDHSIILSYSLVRRVGGLRAQLSGLKRGAILYEVVRDRFNDSSR